MGKDQLRDRLILDGRPANMLDLGQSKWCKGMASASSVSQLFLEEDRDLCICGEDLRDYFYQFSVNPERVRRNALCEKVSQLLKLLTSLGNPWMSMRAMAEFTLVFHRWQWGTFVQSNNAQCAHLSIFLQNCCDAAGGTFDAAWGHSPWGYCRLV